MSFEVAANNIPFNSEVVRFICGKYVYEINQYNQLFFDASMEMVVPELSNFPWLIIVVAAKINCKGEDKDVGESTCTKKVHYIMYNKKLFFYLELKQKQKDNRSSKAFNAVGSEIIVKEFNEKTGLTYEF